MAADRRLALHATLPDRYAHLEVMASTIDHDGRLVVLLADPAQGFVAVPHLTELRPPPLYDATALICAGLEVREIPLKGLDLWFSGIDSLGDGVVLSAARCAAPGVCEERYGEPVPEEDLTLTANVRVFDGHGRAQAAFYAGDGIEQLVTDARGQIWISYFDESNYWFPHSDGTRSYGFMIGLARWDGGGGEPWMVSSGTPTLPWCDCYALNVGRERIRACPYPDFAVVELDANSVRAVVDNPITRCTGLAVVGAEFAFFDQHRAGDGFRWGIRRGRQDGERIIETGREQLELPDGRQPSGWARGRVGRDGMLWLRMDGDPGRWYRYDIDA
ncbi:hypothetical protein ACWT_4967 [Actinoplanes sp. SE50]|uniref:hypothetical protein n=1 Tax=unclassified Actinoplanes TaxID=2626549 RepID=UPI00023ECB64|nr:MULTISPECIES: hypothetical protein [unclassified Actinoplanes]AEV85984.1 hypothetical protein ACPL_5097 [Actinoplanes sp. SE50/110]ATO84382.1 hypothetical protein ACWT_4967 [Actinoplanes sp. SE50]SLM01792.1 hypothetical protein ACSP50_5030 [Actinoplanes sp. SE50/110]